MRTDDGIVVDPSGKMPGRGAYLHRNPECWRIALEGNRIQQALRTKLSAANREALARYADELAIDDADRESAAS